MSYSGLVNGIIPCPYYTKITDRIVDSVAIHAMGGNMTAENCGYWFAAEKPESSQASSNYGIDSSGMIYGYVDEQNASWCTSSRGVDRRSITIEVANTISEEPFTVSDAAYEALIRLLVDICQRWSFDLRWSNNKSYAQEAAKGGSVAKQNMFVHRWFNTNKSCPGSYLMSRMSDIASEVNQRLRSTGMVIPEVEYEDRQKKGKSRIVFIGDSRTVGMRTAVSKKNTSENTDNIWSCQTSMAFDWMKTTGVPAIEKQITADTAVCFLMGINDLTYRNPGDYSNFINDCASRWTQKGAAVYYVSVNPVGDSSSGRNYYNNITNTMIEQFNQKLRNGLDSNVGYIDTYSVILSSYHTLDGLHYDNDTYKNIYQIIRDSVEAGSMQVTMVSSSAVVGGTPVQIDYQKLNPYVVTIDRYTPDSLQYDKLQENGVVGAILETGYLFSPIHTKEARFQQPKFEVQRKLLEGNNLPIGYYVTTRAWTLPEAESEIQELTILIRRHPQIPLGIWVQLDLNSNITINDTIIATYEKRLAALGFASRIGLYTTKENLEKITWSKFQDTWLLWIVDHVEDSSDLKVLFDPEFFDMDGV